MVAIFIRQALRAVSSRTVGGRIVLIGLEDDAVRMDGRAVLVPPAVAFGGIAARTKESSLVLGIVANAPEGIWFQSRADVITVEVNPGIDIGVAGAEIDAFADALGSILFGIAGTVTVQVIIVGIAVRILGPAEAVGGGFIIDDGFAATEGNPIDVIADSPAFVILPISVLAYLKVAFNATGVVVGASPAADALKIRVSFTADLADAASVHAGRIFNTGYILAEVFFTAFPVAAFIIIAACGSQNQDEKNY